MSSLIFPSLSLLTPASTSSVNNPQIPFPSSINYSYEDFLQDETSAVLVAIYLLTFNFAIIIRCFSSPSVGTGLSVLLTIPGYLYLYAVIQHRYKSSLKSLPIRTIHIGNVVVILCALITGFILYSASNGPKCSGFACEETDALQPNFYALAISNTVFTPVAIKSHMSWATTISVIIKLLLLVTSATNVESRPGTFITIFGILFFQGLLLFYYESYTKRMYINKIQIEHQVRTTMAIENEKLVMEMNSKELKSLIGNVAHDLKSPLQAFSFELDTLLSKFQGETTDSCVESVMLLKSISSFMIMLINRCIDYTKATSGIGLKPSLETFNLIETMEWVVRCAERCNRQIPIKIIPSALCLCKYIITDRQWLLENLLCLVSNAQKFTSKGEITIRCLVISPTYPPIENDSIQISEIPAATTNEIVSSPSSSDIPLIRFEIEDCGIGISDEKKKILFKPFKQAQRRAGGTGLGLYSLAKRVEALGGTCGIHDRQDGKQGARFWFTIPYRPDRMVESQNSDLSNQVVPMEETSFEIDRRVTRSSFKELSIGDVDGASTILRTNDSISLFGSEARDKFPLPSLQSLPSFAPSANVSTNANSISTATAPVVLPIIGSGSGSCSGVGDSSSDGGVGVGGGSDIKVANKDSTTTSSNTNTTSCPPPKVSLLPQLSTQHRILLVEDSTLIQKTTTRALTREGYLVDLATNGLECLEMVSQNTYQIVLMDIQMPLMDGFEATTRIRQMEREKLAVLSPQPSTTNDFTVSSRFEDLELGRSPTMTSSSSPSHLIIIGLSANSDSESKDLAMTAGMDAFIPKPLSMDALKLCLKRLNASFVYRKTS